MSISTLMDLSFSAANASSSSSSSSYRKSILSIAPTGLSAVKLSNPRTKALQLSSVPCLRPATALAMEAGDKGRTLNASNCNYALQSQTKLKIGLIGFGNFAQFLAKTMIKQGHSVIATSRSDYTQLCQKTGIRFLRDIDDFCEEDPQVILLCTSILSTEATVRALPLQRLKRNTLFVDVLSVKEFPRNLFLEVLPPECGILCTHPMFGPESGKESWAGLPFVYDKVRHVNEGDACSHVCNHFLSIFETEGCRMVEMSCAEHDRHAAGSQFITHTVGRVLSHLDLESTPINTKGYESLLRLTENTVSDSFDLYYGLFMYNINTTEQMEKLDRAFEAVKQKLFGRLHEVLRKQLMNKAPAASLKPMPGAEPSITSSHTSTRHVKDLSSFVPAKMPSSAELREESGPLKQLVNSN